MATRAFKFFDANFEYELAERVVSAFEPFEKFSVAEGIRASLQMDSRRLVEMHARQFLNDGRVEHLMAAAEQAEAASGWRDAIVWLARATVLQPTVPTGAYRLLRVLETRALAFVGVDWSDDVLRFSEFSGGRKVATPSYGKVRSGLAIGVQSSWANYRFVFDTPHGAKLHKWMDRFGYER